MENKIIVTISKLIFPLIIIFGFYIQVHGSNNPGGGFQAGVIMASALFLHSIVFGYEQTLKAISFRFLKLLSMLGIMLYGGTGIACIIMGGEFLNYNALGDTNVKGQMIGISIVEWGIGLTVFSSFCLCYYAFITKRKDI